jgi:hypothetical protein
MAERIQRKRSKGWKSPPNTVYVGRPTVWGNPFYVRTTLYQDKWQVRHYEELLAEFPTKREAQAEAVRLFEKWFNTDIADIGTELHNFRNRYGWKGFSLACAVNMLSGKNLSCWCGLDESCHAEVILRLANKARSGCAGICAKKGN